MECSQATRYLTFRLSLILAGDSTIIGRTQRNLRNGAVLLRALPSSNSTHNFDCWIELGSVSSSWQSQIVKTVIFFTFLSPTSVAQVQGSYCDVSIDAIIRVISITLRFELKMVIDDVFGAHISESNLIITHVLLMVIQNFKLLSHSEEDTCFQLR